MGLLWIIICAVLILFVLQYFFNYWNERIATNKLLLLEPYIEDKTLYISNDDIETDIDMISHNEIKTINDNVYDTVIASFIVQYDKQYISELLRISKKKIIIMEDINDTESDKTWISYHKKITGNNKFYLNTKQWLNLFEKMKLELEKTIEIDTQKFNILFPVSRKIFILNKK